MKLYPSFKNLSNKTRVLLTDIPSSTSVTALVMVHTGSRYEEERLAGISHFLEHMVFKGTKKYPTALDLAAAVDSVGADFNAFTDKEYTGFYVKAAGQHLELALDVLSEMIWRPKLEEKEIEKEKGVIVEEINMRNDHPMMKVEEEFESLLFGQTNLGREVIGSKKTVLGIKKADFLDFRRQWYQPQNMVVGVVGGIKNKKLIEKYFSLPNKNKQKIVHDNNFQLQSEKIKVIYKKTEQAHFCLGVPTFKRNHKDRYVLNLIAVILGGNMSSRLFSEVREKRGLAYYVKTSPTAFLDTGYLVSQAGTDINKAKQAIKIIQSEYYKIVNDKSLELEKDLKKAKEFIKGKLSLSLEDSKTVALLFSEDLLLEGKIRTPKDILSEIEKVNVDDIKRVSKEIFQPEKLRLTIIGPYKNNSQFKI